MATIHGVYTLSNESATRLTPIGIHSSMDITIQNVNNSGYVYVGGQGVTSENYGYRLMPNHAISWELPERDELYAISSEDGMKIAVLRTSLEK